MATRKLGKRERAKFRAIAEAAFGQVRQRTQDNLSTPYREVQGRFSAPGQVTVSAMLPVTTRAKRFVLSSVPTLHRVIHDREYSGTPARVLQGTNKGEAVFVSLGSGSLGRKASRFQDARCNWDNPGSRGKSVKGKLVKKTAKTARFSKPVKPTPDKVIDRAREVDALVQYTYEAKVPGDYPKEITDPAFNAVWRK